jgi:hypothetical protein
MRDKDPKRGQMISMGDALDRFLHSNDLRRANPNDKIFTTWNQALGPALAKRAVPVRFERGELTVLVESAAHYQELKNFTGSQLRRQTNELLGAKRIERISFKLKR